MKNLRIALVHDYLNQYGGAEKTLEILAQIYPEADIYTSIYNKVKFHSLSDRKIITPKFGGLLKSLPILSKYLTFLLPVVFEEFDFSHYDIVISDSSAYSKGVITNAKQLHISYIHTPPRFLYKYSVESDNRNKWYYKPVVTLVDHYLRIWDYIAAQRADVIACNSLEIKRRIKKFYKRDSVVIYPPVAITNKKQNKITFEEIKNQNYYLIAGRLENYKNFDKVIEAFNELPKYNLVVIGTGKQEKLLRRLAKNNIKFLGKVDEKTKEEYMSKCLGLINAVRDEDFGIVPIEVQALGRPVLAHKSAGHLETVIDGVTGMYFEDLEVNELKKSILEFDRKIRNDEFDTNVITKNTEKFSEEVFIEKFKKLVEEEWSKLNA